MDGRYYTVRFFIKINISSNLKIQILSFNNMINEYQ